VKKVKKYYASFLRSHISMLSNSEEISVAEENALVLVRTFATIAFYKLYALKNNNLALRA
jgi:hypothetical protein